MIDGFFRFPAQALPLLASLSKTEIRVLMAIMYWTHGSSGVCYASMETLGSYTGLARVKAQAAFSKLVARGIANRDGRMISLPGVPNSGTVPNLGTPLSPKQGHNCPQNGDTPVPKLGTQPIQLNKTRNREDLKTQEEPQPAKKRKAKKPKPAATEQVQQLFQVWQESTGRSKSMLDTKRAKDLEAGIKNFGFDQCRLALIGLGQSDWHMGLDPKTNGKKYNEPRNALRDAEHLENFIRLAADAEPKGPTYNDLVAEWMRLLDDGAKSVSMGTADWGKIPKDQDPLVDVAARALVASKIASVQLVKHHPEHADARTVARVQYQNALMDYQEAQKAHDAQRTNSWRNSTGCGPDGHQEDGQGIIW